MDIKIFKYFSVLCECRSVSLAADRLGVTPQGLSGAVRRLSAELGEELVTTKHGVVSPTEYGKLFLALANDVDSSLTNFNTSFATLRAHINGIINVGCIIGSLGYFGEGIFDEFNKSHKDAQVLLTAEIPDNELQEKILDGTYDFGLMINVSSDEIMRVHVASDYSFIWVRDDDLLAKRKMLEPKDLDGRTIYIVQYDFGGDDPVSRELNSEGANVKVVSVGEMIRVFERVRLERALGFTARHHVESMKGLGVTGIPFSRLPFDYYFCYRRDRPMNESSQELVDYMRKRAKMHK